MLRVICCDIIEACVLVIKTHASFYVYRKDNRVNMMLRHGFGIMPEDPRPGIQYEEYEPDKYNCIFVEDESLLPILDELKEMKCYWHSIDRQEKGLAYHGVSLIPPESLNLFESIVSGKDNLQELQNLVSRAKSEKKYIIHFGV